MLNKPKIFISALIITLMAIILQLYPQFFTSNLVLADWVFDATPPSCIITFDPPVRGRSGQQILITLASAVADSIASVTLTPPASSGNLTPPTCTTSNSASTSCTWHTTGLSPDNYTFTGTITDTAGNTGDPPCSATYSLGTALPAYLQTTGGDVHSNQ